MIITKLMLDEIVPKDMIPTRLNSAINLYTNTSWNKHNKQCPIYIVNWGQYRKTEKEQIAICKIVHSTDACLWK